VVSAGFCSSAFLQPTTASDNVKKKSVERIIADTFFIDMSPPFTDFNADAGLQMHDRHRLIKYALFLPCQDKFIII
jgi:hypothetical protein